ncbi:RcnB family protein [Sphingomonas sp. TX0543]|uniref:RcnB family protein n=1 Tax=Sphingomonas sp. TX0543 TaxID=3399682 RepID=UPI003AFB6D57
MRKLISMTLMAAASLLPLSASAQDNAQQRGDRGDRGGAPRGDHQPHQLPGGGWQRPAAPQQGQAPQPQLQQRPQWQRARPDGGQRPPMPDDRANVQRPQWNGGNRDQAQRPQWQGGRPDGANAQPSPWNQRPQWAQPGRDTPAGRPGTVQRPDPNEQGRGSGREQHRADWRDSQQTGGWQHSRPDNYRGGGWQDRDRYQDDPRRGWDDRRGSGGDRYANGNRGRWSRDWRRDTRYDWNRYRYQNRQAFHLPRYYAPYGWDYGYRRFSVGMTLSNMLFAQDYWIDDPWSYRLPEVYGPYRWVRYYNDAVLVDVYSGQVVDVIYDIFW